MIKLDSAEYAKRRKALMEKMSPNSIAILASAPVTVRNRDVEHPFRQDSDFYYLSGFDEEHIQNQLGTRKAKTIKRINEKN